MNTRSPKRAARSWNTLPIDVLEVGHASNQVSTPRIITGTSGNTPGTRVAISISPTDVWAPDSCSDTVTPRFPQRQMAASLTVRGEHAQAGVQAAIAAVTSSTTTSRSIAACETEAVGIS